ncbi:MAG: NAD(+) synthase [Acutalibacteraceae bacterium]|jgi:NAD+ synthase
MRDYKKEFDERVKFIKDLIDSSGTKGIVFGNSGGKDSALVGILCKAACENTLGIMLPCESRQNFEDDTRDALKLAEKYDIETLSVDLTTVKFALIDAAEKIQPLSEQAKSNIAPRLRMTTLYAVAQSRGCLVAGTSNRSEIYLGYFTKWGDGGYDFNPIADLTATEVIEFLYYLDAPIEIIKKAPSAGLFEGQTDEADMGMKYADIDRYLLSGEGEEEIIEKIERFHRTTRHKTKPPVIYKPRENLG